MPNMMENNKKLSIETIMMRRPNRYLKLIRGWSEDVRREIQCLHQREQGRCDFLHVWIVECQDIKDAALNHIT